MNHKRFMALPTNICILVFSGVFLLTALFTYFLHEDTLLLERRIASRQKDLGTVIQLRDSYETKRQAFEKYAPDRSDQRGMSLAVMEAIVAKSFVGGSLASLQPTTTKEDRGGQRMAIDIKVVGAPLSEIVSFIKATENTGLRVGRLRLSLPAANPSTLDMQATVVERRVHG
jgi:hypothetical protein